jgi:hypothetical protein
MKKDSQIVIGIVLTCILLMTLKLLNVIHWPLIWILAPMWFPVLFVIVIVILFGRK